MSEVSSLDSCLSQKEEEITHPVKPLTFQRIEDVLNLETS